MGLEVRRMTPTDQVEMSADERIAKLEKEVARLGSKIVELERKVAAASSPKNAVAAVREHNLRTPQGSR
jgi:phage shock protein A